MPIGFEVAFPSLLDHARSLNIEVPDESSILKNIFAMRDLKLKKIPRQVLHKEPTTLLHSLEDVVKADVLYLLSGAWKPSVEQIFLWIGGSRPSQLLNIIVPQLEPLIDQQIVSINNLRLSSQQAEDAL
ncbi:Transcription factor TGA7 [Glycine soja]|uniref:Transcription factor TGA7 n=1 Tax=Glycine soja TaxID=3848 RepID=A0A0B2PMA8_GLYSO|nr:Transcription factor TGA7 [Glycine soja]